MPTNVPGSKLFNFDTGSGNLQGLEQLICLRWSKTSDAINSKDVTSISAQLTNIDANYNNALACQAQVGSWMSRMEGAKTTLEDTGDRLKTMLSDTEDVDLTEAIVDLKTQENVYQTALSITSRMLNLSLASINQ